MKITRFGKITVYPKGLQRNLERIDGAEPRADGGGLCTKSFKKL